MTRPRRVLTVVVERCDECHEFGWFDGSGQCFHEGRRKYAPAGAEVVNGRASGVYAGEPPPDWCPLPCEPSGKSGQLEEP